MCQSDSKPKEEKAERKKMDEKRSIRVSLAAGGENLQSLLAFDLVSIRCCKADGPMIGAKCWRLGGPSPSSDVAPRLARLCSDSQLLTLESLHLFC